MSGWVEDAAKHIREIVLSICDRAPSAEGMALVIRSHAPDADKVAERMCLNNAYYVLDILKSDLRKELGYV